MKKITKGLITLMVLFTANTFAQDAEGCGIPTLSIDEVTPAAFDPSVVSSTSGQSFEFTEDTLLDSVTYEFQYSDLVAGGGATHVEVAITEITSSIFGLGFSGSVLATSSIFEIPTSGSGSSPIITFDFSALNATLDANTLYCARLRGFTSAAGANLGAKVEVRTSQNNDYADGAFLRTETGVDLGLTDQLIDVYFELVASGIEMPDNAAVTAVVDVTADFDWDGEMDTTYEAKVVLDGADADTAPAQGTTTVTGATANTTGLTASTVYDFYVRATGTCTATPYNSEWSKVDFSTTVLGVADQDLKNAFNLYPNPTNGIINVNGVGKIDSIEVYNIFGSKILSTQNTQINTAGFKSGVYMIKIVSGNASATKMLVRK